MKTDDDTIDWIYAQAERDAARRREKRRAAQFDHDLAAVREAEADPEQRAVRDAWGLRYQHRRDPALRDLAQKAGAPLIRPDSPTARAARVALDIADELRSAAERVLADGGSGWDQLLVAEVAAAVAEVRGDEDDD